MHVSVRCHPWRLPHALISMVRDAWCADAICCPVPHAGLAVLWDTTGYCEYSCRYDFYSPKTNFIFHHYYREGAPKFFELGGGGEAERCSAARTLHCAPWNAACSATCNMQHNAPHTVAMQHAPQPMFRIGRQTVHH